MSSDVAQFGAASTILVAISANLGGVDHVSGRRPIWGGFGRVARASSAKPWTTSAKLGAMSASKLSEASAKVSVRFRPPPLGHCVGKSLLGLVGGHASDEVLTAAKTCGVGSRLTAWSNFQSPPPERLSEPTGTVPPVSARKIGPFAEQPPQADATPERRMLTATTFWGGCSWPGKELDKWSCDVFACKFRTGVESVRMGSASRQSYSRRTFLKLGLGIVRIAFSNETDGPEVDRVCHGLKVNSGATSVQHVSPKRGGQCFQSSTVDSQ